MTNEKAVEMIKKERDSMRRLVDDCSLPITGGNKYIEAYDMAIEALEKQIPKKPEDLKPIKNAAGYIFSKSGKCPCCGETVDYYCNLWVCDFCGQAIKWGGYGEDDE